MLRRGEYRGTLFEAGGGVRGRGAGVGGVIVARMCVLMGEAAKGGAGEGGLGQQQ